MTNVRNFLDLSTGHLKLSTRTKLEECFQPTQLPFAGGITEYGWFLYAEGELDEEVIAETPEDLLACFERAKALKCPYILFDRDGPEDDQLPYYGDGDTQERLGDPEN